ncbi:MAG TPA: MoxR family ATPase [Victivallales bacterium]|nr:MoxR family ATPase [Victivallales bacterium]
MDKAELNELQLKIKEASAFISPLKTEIARTIVGQERLVNRLIMALLADGHLLIEGLPGLAKTLAVKILAGAINGTFSRIQFTPDLLPADLIGTNVFNQQTQSFHVKTGPIFANIVLADEINRAPAKVQSALLECMQEKQVTIGGKLHKVPLPFLVMATQNPIEQEGTYPLPEAQIDRFMFNVELSYPERDEEITIINKMSHPELQLTAVPVTSLEEIMNARKWVDKVYIDEKIVEYILDIVVSTRPNERKQLSSRQSNTNLSFLDNLIQFGASPRAGIMMTLAAKTAAFMEGRAYVVPQDVKNITHDILRHRIILSYEAEAEGVTTNELISKILDELRTP